MKNFRTLSDWLGISRTVSDSIELNLIKLKIRLEIRFYLILFQALSDWFGIPRIDSDSNSFGRFGQFRTPLDYLGLCRIHSESVGSFHGQFLTLYGLFRTWLGIIRTVSDSIGLFRTLSDWFGIGRIVSDSILFSRFGQFRTPSDYFGHRRIDSEFK